VASDLRAEDPPLATFLTALAETLGARIAYFVPSEAGVAAARSYLAQPIPESELSELDDLARRWLAGPHANVAHLPVADGRLVEIAAVEGEHHEMRGALLVEHRAQSSDALAEDVEFAAGLISVILDNPPTDPASDVLVEWAASQPGARAAFAVSVDDLGVVNEVLGYSAGDAILRTIAARLQQWTGPHGRLARVGGARYIAIRTDLPDAASAARETARLRTEIAVPVMQGGLPVSRSASVGVAVDVSGTVPPRELLRRAVQSGAAARSGGGDDVALFDPDAAANRIAQLRLGLELHGALANGDLRVHYQPEYDLESRRIVGVEALLRWQHPSRGLLGAENFVPLAEHTHTFAAVQRWVVDESCRHFASWIAAGAAEGLVLRVNVAAAQILHGEIANVFAAALDRHRLPPGSVCLELTERRMPADRDGLAATLDQLRRRGVAIAVDDFGTGEGTLSHLLALPLDVIKLDRDFVRRLTTNARAAAIVTSVMALADALNLGVVAEGIDGPETVAALLRLGCTRGQGNALSPAAGPDEIIELLRDQPPVAHP
jgi:EAL domain-containing protein (putative c-di-GMP-specific phosphodiesterase class I)/GGDEF domain-containing protein